LPTSLARVGGSGIAASNRDRLQKGRSRLQIASTNMWRDRSSVSVIQLLAWCGVKL